MCTDLGRCPRPDDVASALFLWVKPILLRDAVHVGFCTQIFVDNWQSWRGKKNRRSPEPLAYKDNSGWVVANLNELGELPKLLKCSELEFAADNRTLEDFGDTLRQKGHTGDAITPMIIDAHCTQTDRR